MKPSTKPLKRLAGPRKRNPQRKKREWARAYHSKERVAFVKSLPCQMCFIVGQTDNAHVGKKGAGAGRKANYDQIAALCRRCHTDYDNGNGLYERDTDGGRWNRMLVLCAADRTEKMWQSHLGGEQK